MPFGQRKKVVEKARSRGRRAAKNTASEIVAGMQVWNSLTANVVFYIIEIKDYLIRIALTYFVLSSL